MKLPARYFDGRSSAARAVWLQAQPGWLSVSGEDVQRREPLSALRIGERLGSAPRRIEFADGASCEVTEDADLRAWLHILGHRDSTVDRLQRSLPMALAAVLAVVLAAAAGYRWGIPLLSEFAAYRLPPRATEAIAEQTLSLLDDRLLQPSQLKVERRGDLQSRFRALATGGDVSARLLFRSSPSMGANALALPDGRIVLLDELVALTTSDEEILAVLAHELAHVEHRHGLQAMIRSSLVGALVAWWIGDFGPLISAAPVALLQARHSRALEQEADMEAARRLCAQGIAPKRLADILRRLGAVRGGEDSDRLWSGYLSTHPATQERARALEALSCS